MFHADISKRLMGKTLINGSNINKISYVNAPIIAKTSVDVLPSKKPGVV